MWNTKYNIYKKRKEKKKSVFVQDTKTDFQSKWRKKYVKWYLRWIAFAEIHNANLFPRFNIKSVNK